MKPVGLKIAMLAVHSCPLGDLGTRDTGGMSVYIRELARELGNRGHRVDIFTRLHDREEQGVSILSDHVRLIHLQAGDACRMDRLSIYARLTDFQRQLEDFARSNHLEYDLVHSHYWLSACVGSRVHRSWEVPHVVMFHTLGAVKNAIGVGEKEPEERIASESALVEDCDCIVAATEEGKEELVKDCNASPDKIAVIPCGVNLDLFRPLDKSASRHRLGIHERERVFLSVGRIDPLKGMERFLLSGAYLKNAIPFKFLIIGGDERDQPELQRLMQLSRQIGIQDSVVFGGRVKHEELPLYYSAADALVMLSHHESFGLVPLESLACGTPVVATKVGGIEGRVRDGETGYLVTTEAPSEIAEKMCGLLSRSNCRADRTRSIRASVAGFSWGKVADAMIGEYARLLNGGHGTRISRPADV